MFKKLVLSLLIMFSLFIEAQAEDLKSINILYVKTPFNLQNIVMKEQKLLEKEFAAEQLQINWIPLGAGSRQAQALAAGSVDLAAVMNTASLLLANAAGNRILIADGVAKPSALFAVVSKNVSDIASLKGKTVAGPKGTVLHQLLMAALEKNNLTANDVNFISMNQKAALSALLAGRVDAALLAGNLMLSAKKAGAVELMNAKDATDVNLTLAVSDKFAKNHADELARIVKVHRDVLDWIKQNPEEAIRLGAQENSLDQAEAKELFSKYDYYNHFSDAELKQLQATEDFLIRSGMIKNRSNLEELILPIAK